MLHTVNKSPFGNDTLETCIRFALPGDPILLIEDGVYAVQAGNRFASMIEAIQQKNPVFALQPDLNARGISEIANGVTTVDYEGFVKLVEQHQVNSWL